MSWWDRLLGREARSIENPSVSLTSDAAFYEVFGGGIQSAAGENVTFSKALGVPAYWGAINFIAGTFASLPCQVFDKTDGGRKVAEGNPLYSILHDVVNDDNLTSFAWRKGEMIRVLGDGGRSLTFIERNRAGRVMNLWPLDARKVTVVRENGYRYYRTKKADGTPVTYNSDEIIDIAFMMEADGITHIDPISRLKNAIGLALALENYASKFFQNGGIPPLVLQGPGMSLEAAKRASGDTKAALKNAQAEQRNVLVLPGGFELKPIGVDPEKGQLVEARKFQLLEIARIFGLPPTFLQDLEYGTFSNTEQQDLQFVKHTLTQWLTAWEAEMNAKLFGVRNRKSYVEFNADGILRGDFKSRMEGYATGINSAVLKPNEARAMENRDNDPDGDRLYVQGAVVPLADAGKLQATNTTPPADGGANDVAA